MEPRLSGNVAGRPWERLSRDREPRRGGSPSASLSKAHAGSPQLFCVCASDQMGILPGFCSSGLARVVGLGGRPQRGQRLGCLCLFGAARVQYLPLPTSPLLLPQVHRGVGCGVGGTVASLWGLQGKAPGLENPGMLFQEGESNSRGELYL